jgi:2-phosphosulfolactate phosphatase
MIFDQSAYNTRCEWGQQGLTHLAPVSDVIIIVDVLSFSTAVDIAISRGAIIYPYRWKDERIYEFAEMVGAEVAGKNHPRGYSLSPASLESVSAGMRLVLPSPNGSHLSSLAGSKPLITGCLRNCRAVAESAMRKGKNIAVIPAGERWEDASLRPCLEDLIGAGAIIKHLQGSLSPEAELAVAAFERASSNLTSQLLDCASGKEKVVRGEKRDVLLAAELNASSCVPLFNNNAYKREM